MFLSYIFLTFCNLFFVCVIFPLILAFFLRGCVFSEIEVLGLSLMLLKTPLCHYVISSTATVNSHVFEFMTKVVIHFLYHIRNALGPTQPPIQWLTGALSLGVKRPGREADHSPLSSAEVKE
jgi:hypothetical protein